jgi:hypothetical protein
MSPGWTRWRGTRDDRPLTPVSTADAVQVLGGDVLDHRRSRRRPAVVLVAIHPDHHHVLDGVTVGTGLYGYGGGAYAATHTDRSRATATPPRSCTSRPARIRSGRSSPTGGTTATCAGSRPGRSWSRCGNAAPPPRSWPSTRLAVRPPCSPTVRTSTPRPESAPTESRSPG